MPSSFSRVRLLEKGTSGSSFSGGDLLLMKGRRNLPQNAGPLVKGSSKVGSRDSLGPLKVPFVEVQG